MTWLLVLFVLSIFLHSIWCGVKLAKMIFPGRDKREWTVVWSAGKCTERMTKSDALSLLKFIPDAQYMMKIRGWYGRGRRICKMYTVTSPNARLENEQWRGR